MLQWRNYPVIKSNQIHQLGRRWGEVEKRKTQYHHSLAIVSKLWKHQNRWQRRRWRLLDRRGREARSHLQSRHREGSRKGGDKKVQAYLLPRPHGWLPNTSLWSAVFKSLRGLLVIMDPERKGCNPEAPLPPHTHTPTKTEISSDATEPEHWVFYTVQAADFRPSWCFSAPKTPFWNGLNVKEVVNICAHL